MFMVGNVMKMFKNIITEGASKALDDEGFLEVAIHHWKFSPKRLMQIDGERYYNGDHDILMRKRTVIGKDGELVEVKNLPNNRIVNNQFRKVVDQKANYLLSKPLVFESEDKQFNKELKAIFNRTLMNRIKNGCVDAYCGGISWLYPYYDEHGELRFQRFKSYEVLPFWKDSEHTVLDMAVRLYEVEVFEGTKVTTQEKVEVFKSDGVYRYDLINGHLHKDIDNPMSPYIKLGDTDLTWDEIPLIAFKSKFDEIPMIKKIKGLQDALNEMISDFVNNMQEDSRSTILVIKNYDGQDLGEFRQKLAMYGAVKVRTIDGADGGVDTLQVEINPENYELILKTLKTAIIENAMSYDAKDDKLGQNANQMNLLCVYNDISLDADNTEAEYQESFEKLLKFIKWHLKNTGKGDFIDVPVTITFNRDMIQNESDIIRDMVSLGVQLPNSLLVGQIPFVHNVQTALDELKKEREEEMDIYGQNFGDNPMKGEPNEGK